MSIDALPEENSEQLFQRMLKQMKEDPKKELKRVKRLRSRALLPILIRKNEIDGSEQAGQVSHEKIRLVKDFKEFTVNVNGTQSIEKAFVTGGGVSVKEINPKEMSSKFTNGLYFCGEVLDIHGYTGGYNITSALVTGRIAGTTAGENAK